MTDQCEELLRTMKRAGAVLGRHSIPFALMGGFAVYARGGTTSDHDVDFLIREQDADKVLDAFAEAGFATERPPEDWLVKAYDDGRLIDFIFRPVERPVTDEILEDTDIIQVSGMYLPVLPASTLMVHKLLSFNQHACDFSRAMPLARTLREQIDWDLVRRETKQSPYAQSFLVLLEILQVLPQEVVA